MAKKAKLGSLKRARPDGGSAQQHSRDPKRRQIKTRGHSSSDKRVYSSDDAFETPSEDSSSEDDWLSEPEVIAVKHKPRKSFKPQKLRPGSPKRAVSPLEPQEDIPLDFPTILLDTSDAPEETCSAALLPQKATPSQTLSLRIQIPKGEFVVNLDLQSIKSLAEKPDLDLYTPSHNGFLSLPGELRNQIYRLVLVTSSPVNLRSPGNWSRSSALLQTCRQVHTEARQVLYGENIFEVHRQVQSRGVYYDKEWTEVAYKDCWRFFATIGPLNISLIRELTLWLADGYGRQDLEKSRFVNDDCLMQCLKVLAASGQLKTLRLAINGKRMVRRTDTRFLDNLCTLKADTVHFIPIHQTPAGFRLQGRNTSKTVNVDWGLEHEIVNNIERATKLWNDEPPICSRTRRKTRYAPSRDNYEGDLECLYCNMPFDPAVPCCTFAMIYDDCPRMDPDEAMMEADIMDSELDFSLVCSLCGEFH